MKDYVVPVYFDGLTFCNIKSKDKDGGAAVFYKDQVDKNGSPVGKSYVTENGEIVSNNGDTQYPISGTLSEYPLYKLTMNR